MRTNANTVLTTRFTGLGAPEGYNPHKKPCLNEDGYGARTDRGYRTVYVPEARKRMREHILVWEAHHGMPVPEGKEIHHLDGNKLNNHPSNLLAVTRLEHARLHAGCILLGDEWFKPCRHCGETKPLTDQHWYFGPNSNVRYGKCKDCHNLHRRIDRLVKLPVEVIPVPVDLSVVPA